MLFSPVAYRLDCVAEYEREIQTWSMRDSDIASIRCPEPYCSAQYGLLFPFGLTADQKTACIDFLLQDLRHGCPNHSQKVDLKCCALAA
jgi:hypothetical protein